MESHSWLLIMDFLEFSNLGLGIITNRNSRSFEKGLEVVDKNYDKLKSKVNEFRKKLKWDLIANEHLNVYENILNSKKGKEDVNLVPESRVPEKP